MITYVLNIFLTYQRWPMGHGGEAWALGHWSPRAKWNHKEPMCLQGIIGPKGSPGVDRGFPGSPWDPRAPWDPWGAKFKILFKSRSICTVAKLDLSNTTSVFLHHGASDWAI